MQYGYLMLLLCGAAPALCLRVSPPMMMARNAPKPASYVPEGRVLKGGLPDEVFQMTNFATGGARTDNTVAEIEMNWKAFKGCFASEALAIEAAKKNSAVFSPQFSSPTKIKGTYALLVKRLGKAETAALLMKNPGVLCNSPGSLEKCSDAEILSAAETVAMLDANKPLIKGVAGVVLLAVVASLFLRTSSINPDGAIQGMDEVTALKAKAAAKAAERAAAKSSSVTRNVFP